MLASGALRIVFPKIARRSFASAVAHGQTGKDVKVHPLFNDHPVAPVVTYDDVPIPVLPYKEGYEKPQAAFNAMLAASVITFLAMTYYMYANDVLGMRLGSPPSWYTKRKIGKGLGDID